MEPQVSLEAVLALHRAGRLDEAEQGYRALQQNRPTDPDILHLLGFLLHQRGQHDAGLLMVERALSVAPDISLYHANRGEILLVLGRRLEAETALRRALALDGNFLPARATLCKLLIERGLPEEALSLSYPPQGDEGTGAKLLINRAVAQSTLGRKLEALATLSRALALDPSSAAAHGNLGNTLRDLGDWPGALNHYRRAQDLAPDLFIVHSNIMFCRLLDPAATGEDLLAQGCAWEVRQGTPAASPPRAANPDKRLRVGYVSPDFREHAIAYFAEPLIAAHDRGRIEVFCYSNVARPDATTARLRGLADVWRDVSGLDDGDFAERVRADGIDILVDLAGHTAGNRLLAMAGRPAPVQVTLALAYGGTTGLSWIDYILTDAVLTPPGMERHFSETVIRLPGTFGVFQPRPDWPDAQPLPEGPPLLGCFTDPARIDGGQVELWRRVLDSVPEARILFKHPAYDSPDMAAHWRRLLGAVADRAIFEGVPGGWGANMEVYGRVSVMLDSWPASGTSSSLIMLWMGLPVVTLAGGHANQRLTTAILAALGLDDLAASDGDAYVALVAGLIRDRPRLGELRQSLRQRLRASPLLDAGAHARAVEDAYGAMWRDACRRDAQVRGDLP